MNMCEMERAIYSQQLNQKAGKHHIQVTDHRKREDFAKFMRWLILTRYKSAKKVNIVLDNLNTHFVKSFEETFPSEIVEKIMNKTKFVYTPKHASWLNMAEIEINMMSHECLSRNIGSKNEIISETSAWCDQNNLDKKKFIGASQNTKLTRNCLNITFHD